MTFMALRTLRNLTRQVATPALGLLVIPFFNIPFVAALPQHNVPKAIQVAADQGRVNPASELNLTVVLKLHNQAEFDQVVEDLYNPASSRYRQWLTNTDFEKYAPTASEIETVKSELTSHGLTVISVDPQRFSIRVHGTASAAEDAFQTELHTFSYNGATFQAHVRDAQLTGAAGALVESVAGLERHPSRPQLAVLKDPRTGESFYAPKALTKAEATGGFAGQITNIALGAPQSFQFTTTASSLPVGIYYGNVYDPSGLPVALTPQQLQTHYGLTSLIKQGYDGRGQTIALVEAYGYDAAESDANAYSSIFGLPTLTTKNYAVYYPEGKPANPLLADQTGWTKEIAMDIEQAHSIAPGAKIAVVASAGQDNEDQIASLQYIISHKLANTVSSSWENDQEILSGPAEENAFNAVLKLGAAAGISFQFSTGDTGDLGLGSPSGSVSVPSNSPYATAVGGTSILNNPKGGSDIVAGWGNILSSVDSMGPVNPPAAKFNGGAGGGESLYYAKPSWQKALPGTGRQVPDVSALADPSTGVVVIYTTNGMQTVSMGVGGTSLACPLFTGIWAIAEQYARKSLGQAAPAVSRLTSGQITDVLPTTSINATDPAGIIYTANGTDYISAAGLFNGLLYTQTAFPSAMWHVASGFYDAISFGTDTSLTVTPGWDNVTGYGEPNGLPFIQAVAK